MSDITQRLKQILSYYNLNSADFSTKVGVQKSSVSHLLSGRNKPSFDFINKLANAFIEISIEWFVTGKGEMIKEKYIDNPVAKQSAIENTANIDNNLQAVKHPSDEKMQVPEIANNSNASTASNPFSQKNEINSVLLVYDDDTFKILKQR
jgi:transcriptional regulator with XRE-family HTH domain